MGWDSHFCECPYCARPILARSIVRTPVPIHHCITCTFNVLISRKPARSRLSGELTLIYQRPGTRQQVREARRVWGFESPLRAEQVPLWKYTIGISQLVVSQFVAVWV
jgi:hypothetical protein